MDRYGATLCGLLDVGDNHISIETIARDAAIDYETAHFRELQAELKALNEAAVASGLLPQPREAEDAFDEDEDAPPRELAPDKGKARASRLLEMAGRIDGDASPAVPGTAFTEAGVVRLIAHLRKRQVRRFPFLRRLHRFLTLPTAIGVRTSAGVAVERLQVASRQLKDIEAQGWDRYSAIREARRFGAPPPPPEAATPAVAKSSNRAKSSGKSKSSGKAKSSAKTRSPGKAETLPKTIPSTRKAS